MRPWFIILILTVIGTSIIVFLLYINLEIKEVVYQVIMLGIIFVIIVMWFMNKKYLKDLSNGFKIIEEGPIVNKTMSTKGMILSINGKNFVVEKEFWECSCKGDDIEIHYSSISRIVLELKLKDKAIYNYY